MSVLAQYSFRIILLGTIFLSIASGIMGSINLYKRQSLIGDAIGHATFLGVVLAFMLTASRDPLILLIGASLSGLLCYVLITLANRFSKIRLDANLAIFMTGFFGFGLVLKSYIQGNPNFRAASQSGLGSFIFGQTAYMLEQDVWLLAGIAAVIVCFFTIFRVPLMIALFDRDFAQAKGMRLTGLELMISVLSIVVISAGIKAVGAILISAFFILPTICAGFHTKRLIPLILIAIGSASIASFAGVYAGSLYGGLSTGPAIILAMGVLTLLSLAFGRYGYLGRRRLMRRKSDENTSGKEVSC